MNAHVIETRLTPAQYAAVEWAADPMISYWANADECGLPDDETIPLVLLTHSGKFVKVTARRDVLEDLKYRLTIQFADLDDGGGNAACRAAANAWERIAKDAAAAPFFLKDIRIAGFERPFTAEEEF